MTERKAIVLTLLEAVILAFFSLFLYPSGDRWLSAAGDANYFTALFVGFNQISHGTDLVFMRGPLNFLAFPKLELPAGAYWSAIVFNLITGWVLLASPWYYFKSRVNIPITLFVTGCFGLLAAPHVAFGVLYARWLLPALLLMVSALDVKRESLLMLITVYTGVLAALQLLIVFSSGLMLTASFAIYLFLLIIRGRWVIVAAGVAGFVIALCFSWSLSAGPEPSLSSYLLESWQMSKSYGEVFALDLIFGYRWMMILALLITGAGGLIFLLGRQWKMISYLIISAPMLFYFYKHGVIRHDSVSYYETIFSWGFILFTGTWIDGATRSRAGYAAWRWGGIALLVLSMVVLKTAFSMNQLGNLGMSTKSPLKLVNDVNMLLKPDERSNQQALNREEIRSEGLFPEHWIALIGSSPVIILPQHVTLLEAYGLNWVIPPSLFSYLAVSPAQDLRDSEWYEKRGPEYLIWYPSAIDDQCMAWYQPLAMRTIAAYYRIIDQEGDLELLKRRDIALAPIMQTVVDGFVTPDDVLQIPSMTEGARIFVFMDIKLSLLGRLISMIYRIDPAHMTITWADGRTTRCRLVRENSAHGLWVSSSSARGLLNIDDAETEPQAVRLQLDASRWIKFLFVPEIHYWISVESVDGGGEPSSP